MTRDEQLEEIVNEAVKHVPSSFNSQSGRVVVLLGEQHQQLWELTEEELRKIVPADSFMATEAKIDGSFRSGYGSILYFADIAVIRGLQQQLLSLTKLRGIPGASPLNGSSSPRCPLVGQLQSPARRNISRWRNG